MFTKFQTDWSCRLKPLQFLWALVLTTASLGWMQTGFAQGSSTGDCSGKFTVEASRSYDPATNKTTFTYKITKIGSVNGLSHFSIPLECTPPTPGLNISQILSGYVAQYSNDGVSWSTSSASYGVDPSQSCNTGNVFKFNQGASGSVIWFRLIINGNWRLTPATGVVKYGSFCCVVNITGGSCLQEACPDINVLVNSETICAGQSATLTADITGGVAPYIYEWSGPNGFTGSTASVSVSEAGLYEVIVTDVNGCTSLGEATVTVNPVSSSTQSRTICSKELPYSWDGLTFTAAGEQTKTGLVNQYGCDSTATYTLSVNPETSSTQSRTICSKELPYSWDGLTFTAAGEQTKTGLVNQYGCDSTATYTLSVNPETSSTQSRTICSKELPYSWDGLTFTAAGEQTKSGLVNQYGCDSTAKYILTVITLPVVTVIDVNVFVGGTVQLTGTPAGGTWSGANVSASGLFNASGLAAGLYTVTYTVNNGACSVSANAQVRVDPSVVYCTYTQGYFGNTGGMACTPDGQKTTAQLITGSLANMPGGVLYLGVSGRSFTATNAADIIRIMPGGGPASRLPNGNHTPNSSVILKKGKVNNVLLSQTIALALNTYMQASTLGGLSLANGGGSTNKFLVTVAKKGGDCSSLSTSVPAECRFSPVYCSDGVTISGYTTTYNPYKSWSISAKVINALPGNKTVLDLLNLASAALGGTLPAGVSYSDIAGAAAAINEAFDECRIFVGFASTSSVSSYCTPPAASACPAPIISTRTRTNTTVAPASVEVKELTMNAYPNPFKEQLNFRFVSPVSGKAVLEVYNVHGQRLGIVYEGNITAGSQNFARFSNEGATGMLIYKLSVGGQVLTGKVQSLK